MASPYLFIMPSGDSLTVGFGSTTSDGWRRPNLFDIQKRSRISGEWISCVGSSAEGLYSEDRHQATSGANIYDLNVNLTNVSGPVGNLRSQVTDILSVQIGGEDCAGGGGVGHNLAYVPYDGTPSCTVGQAVAMLNNCWALQADLVIMWMNQIAINPVQTTENANRVDYNAGMVIEVAALLGAGKRLVPVDVRGALGTFDSNNYFDQRHPNTAGYTKEFINPSAAPPTGWASCIFAGLQAAVLLVP